MVLLLSQHTLVCAAQLEGIALNIIGARFLAARILDDSGIKVVILEAKPNIGAQLLTIGAMRLTQSENLSD